jgi:hypothetical protein
MMPAMIVTNSTILCFPPFDAFFVPDWSHGKQAIGTRRAPEVPSGMVGKHRVLLEAQAPA